jgi:regulator of protease activity HflC (stomatin/prohibitin superfamily)
VRFQKVDAGGLTDVLAKRKNADLENQSIMREAEGEAQQIRSRARGEAKAITNAAQAEADAVREVARAISRTGENPTRYLLALKYIDALRTIMSQPATDVQFVPTQTSHIQTMQAFGVTPALVAAM